MSNPCLEFFAKREHEQILDFVDLLPDMDTCVLWETKTASHQSPGPVSNEEDVLRRVVSPVHVQLNEPTPACFGDLWNKGLSVDREAYAPASQSLEDAKKWVEGWNSNNSDKPPRVLTGLARLRVCDVRALMNADKRALAIFDTATQSNVAHADVCAVGTHNKNTKKDIRASLWGFAKGSLGLP